MFKNADRRVKTRRCDGFRDTWFNARVYLTNHGFEARELGGRPPLNWRVGRQLEFTHRLSLGRPKRKSR